MRSAAEHMLSMPLRRQLFAVGAIALAAGWWDGEWILSAALLGLWLIWAIAPMVEGPPVLALALTFQWVQCSIGLLYIAATGRVVGAAFTADYRVVVLISLGCVLATALGLRVAIMYYLRNHSPLRDEPSLKVGWVLIVVSYVVPTIAEPAMLDFAFTYLGVGQAVLALRFIRLAALYLVLRRCVQAERWLVFATLVLLELGLSLTSYYAGFREPLVIAVAAIIERFHPRNLTQAVTLIVVFALGSVLGLAWLGVRTSYRADYDSDLLEQTREARSSRLTQLGAEFFASDPQDLKSSMDQLVDRMWAVRYPSLAYSRVPDVMPHTNGALFLAALQHVAMPRLFFPDKQPLESDSELVRRYSGVWVAGVEQNTTIAFGYAIESYIDYGIPLMFLPSFGWGLFLGLAFGWLTVHLHTEELRIGLIMVIFWIALYLFERSWARTMGIGGTLLIYLGLPAVLLDRLLFHRAQRLNELVLGLDTESGPPTTAARY